MQGVNKQNVIGRQPDLFASAIGDHYSRLADWMIQQPWYRDDKVVRAIRARLVKEPRRILELCCGSGAVLHALAKQLPNVRFVGVDISRRMVELATVQRGGRPNIDIVHGDWVYNLMQRNPFDVVIVKNSLHLLDELPRRLRSMRYFISERTRLIVVETVSPTPVANRFVKSLFELTDRPDFKQSFFTAETLENVLSEGGWLADAEPKFYVVQHIDTAEWLAKKCSTRAARRAALQLLRSASSIEQLHRAMQFDCDPGEVPGRMLRLQYVRSFRPTEWLTYPSRSKVVPLRLF